MFSDLTSIYNHSGIQITVSNRYNHTLQQYWCTAQNQGWPGRMLDAWTHSQHAGENAQQMAEPMQVKTNGGMI